MNPLQVPREGAERVRLVGHASETNRVVNSPAERFSHLMLAVSDVGRSEKWYQEVVGLDLLGRDLTAEERPHSVLRMNTGQLLILVQVPEEEMRTNLGMSTGVHHAFMTTPNQYRRAITRMEEMGFDLVDYRAQFRAYGEFSINFKDPDGHRLQLQCYGLESTEIMPGDGIVDCGTEDQYRVGAMKPFKAGNFYLVRRKDGLLAISRWCRHLNGLAAYPPKHWQLWLPPHGATDAPPRVNEPFPSNEGKDPLRLHPLTFNAEGHILVDTDRVIERTQFELSQVTVPPAVAAAAPA